MIDVSALDRARIWTPFGLLTFLVSIITLGRGRTILRQGAVHLVVFAAFLFLTLVP